MTAVNGLRDIRDNKLASSLSILFAFHVEEKSNKVKMCWLENKIVAEILLQL